MKELLSGNEAVARGAYEAGVEIAAAYPGTPSTEILENIARYDEIYAEWSVNEKVAFEVAFGAAVAGKRALAAMKHVGVNVASDALMTAAYTGVNAGFVLISADDPGMHSSQNEQDNRYYARMAQIPMLEPSNSQEAKDFTHIAFDLSERFDTPVMIRMTTRICHGKGIVVLEERSTPPNRVYKKDAQKYVMIPAHARQRHEIVRERLQRLQELSESFHLNRIEEGTDDSIGVITSGVSYEYAKEVLPHATFLKLAMTHPLPLQTIKDFAQKFETVYVIEELEPFLEEQIRAAGIDVIGKQIFPITGELSPEIIRERLNGNTEKSAEPSNGQLPPRPPVMCPGCPHRAVFHVLKKLRVVISGDIGCYTLSTLPPLNTMDTVLCMGSSIGIAQGLVRTLDEKKKNRVVSVIGDSTFIHSGLPSLVNAVYNQANITIIILDNRTTAMTGHQDNPGTGKTLKGDSVPSFDFEAMARAAGIGYVQTIDPIDIENTDRVIREALAWNGPSVVVAQRPCALTEKDQFPGHMHVDPELCTECKLCLQAGCPSLSLGDGAVEVNEDYCFGCGLCQQICPQDAISRVEDV